MTSSALQLEPAVGLQWMQNGGVAIRFRNTGKAACLLRGRPFVVATSPGHPSVVATKLGLAATGGEVADTPVGGTVSVDVSAPISCVSIPAAMSRACRSTTVWYWCFLAAPNVPSVGSSCRFRVAWR